MRVTFDTAPHTGTMIGINTDNNKAIVKLDNGDEIEVAEVRVAEDC